MTSNKYYIRKKGKKHISHCFECCHEEQEEMENDNYHNTIHPRHHISKAHMNNKLIHHRSLFLLSFHTVELLVIHIFDPSS